MKEGIRASGREAIRTAAIQLFAERGFAATSTREICEQAQVTKPVLYYHFGNKEQLYRELIVDADNQSRKQLVLAAARGRTAEERLIEILAADFALTRREPAMSQLFFRMIFAPKKETPAIDFVGMGYEWLRLLEGIAKDGVRNGEFRGGAREIADALLGIHLIYTMGFLLTGRPVLDRVLAQRIVRKLIKGYGPVTGR